MCLAVLSEDWSSFSLCSAVLSDGWSSAGLCSAVLSDGWSSAGLCSAVLSDGWSSVQQYCICLMFISIWSCSSLCSTISGLVFVCVWKYLV